MGVSPAKYWTISTSGIDVGGAEGADAIRAVLRSKSGQVKYCYEQRLKENPKYPLTTLKESWPETP